MLIVDCCKWHDTDTRGLCYLTICRCDHSQITGFDNANVQKGSVKTLAFDDKAFADVPTLGALYVRPIALAVLS